MNVMFASHVRALMLRPMSKAARRNMGSVLAAVGALATLTFGACLAIRPTIAGGSQDGQGVELEKVPLRYGIATIDGANVELWFSEKPIPCEHHLLHSKLETDVEADAFIAVLPRSAQKTGGPLGIRTLYLHGCPAGGTGCGGEESTRDASTVTLTSFSTFPGAHIRGTLVVDAEGGYRATKSAIGGSWARRGSGSFDVRVCTRVGWPTIQRVASWFEKR